MREIIENSSSWDDHLKKLFSELGWSGEGTARPPLLAPADRTMHSRAQKYTNLLPSNSQNRPTWINIIQINFIKT